MSGTATQVMTRTTVRRDASNVGTREGQTAGTSGRAHAESHRRSEPATRGGAPRQTATPSHRSESPLSSVPPTPPPPPQQPIQDNHPPSNHGNDPPDQPAGGNNPPNPPASGNSPPNDPNGNDPGGND